MAYHPKKHIISSVSDDRSARLWKVCFPTTGGGTTDWAEATFHLMHVLYGHAARVWDLRLLNEYIVTVGEDATCMIWGYDGKVCQKFKGHMVIYFLITMSSAFSF